MREFIETTLRDAGNILLEYFGSVKIIGAKKHARDTLTEADLKTQEYIVDAIQKKYPGTHIVAEEEGVKHNAAGHEWVWYVDPLDGTYNFSTRTPLFGPIIGLSHNGVLQYGGIGIPVAGEIYVAKKGAGAFMNGSRITCSQHADFPTSVGIGGMGVGGGTLDIARALEANGGKGAWNQGIGSAAVSAAWVAAGRRDWFISRFGSDWDYAAGVVILEEAGCIVTNLKGEPWTYGDNTFVAANPTLHAFIMESLRKYPAA